MKLANRIFELNSWFYSTVFKCEALVEYNIKRVTKTSFSSNHEYQIQGLLV